jgi:hypothetical protein
MGRTATEQPMAQPATTSATERVVEDPAQEGADVNAPIRDEGAVVTPPRSSVVEEENRAPSPARVEDLPVEAAAQEGAPDLGKVPMMPSTVAVSDDEVEEIYWCPHDGRQHIYVWRQHGDHRAGHEEIAEVEEAARRQAPRQ